MSVLCKYQTMYVGVVWPCYTGMLPLGQDTDLYTAMYGQLYAGHSFILSVLLSALVSEITTWIGVVPFSPKKRWVIRNNNSFYSPIWIMVRWANQCNHWHLTLDLSCVHMFTFQVDLITVKMIPMFTMVRLDCCDVQVGNNNIHYPQSNLIFLTAS